MQPYIQWLFRPVCCSNIYIYIYNVGILKVLQAILPEWNRQLHWLCNMLDEAFQQEDSLPKGDQINKALWIDTINNYDLMISKEKIYEKYKWDVPDDKSLPKTEQVMHMLRKTEETGYSK